MPSRHPQCTSPTHFLFSFMETTNKASIFSLRVGFRNLGDFCTFILFKCHSRASFYRFITSSSFLGILELILFSMQPVTNLVCKLEIRRRRKNNKVALSALGVLVWIEIFMILSCLCQMTSSGKEIDLPK